jgi:ribosome-associated protein
VDIVTEKKAENILLLDVREVAVFTDFFIICSATSERQVEALRSAIREETKAALRVVPLNVEGEASSGWVLMDYGSVIVHLFSPEVRAYYNLEGLWRDGRVIVRIQ